MNMILSLRPATIYLILGLEVNEGTVVAKELIDDDDVELRHRGLPHACVTCGLPLSLCLRKYRIPQLVLLGQGSIFQTRIMFGFCDNVGNSTRAHTLVRLQFSSTMMIR